MADDIYSQTTNNADARLIRVEADPTALGFKLTRGWPWLAGAAASGDTIQDLVEARAIITSVVNPQANASAYSGTFVTSEVEARDETFQGEAERTTAIVETLTKVKAAPGSVGALGTPDQNYEERTLNYRGLQEAVRKVWVYRYRNLNPADRDTIIALNPTKASYTIVDKDLITERDQTATYVVAFKLTADIWTNTTPTNVLIGRSNEGGLDEKRTDEATGVPTLSAAAALDAETATAGHVIDALRLTELSEEESKITKRQSKVNANSTQYEEVFVSDRGEQEETQTLHWKNITEANANTIIADAKTNKADMTAADPVAPASHEFKNHRKISNGNATFDLYRITFIPNSDTSGVSGSETWTNSTGLTKYYWVTYQVPHEIGPRWTWVKLTYNVTFHGSERLARLEADGGKAGKGNIDTCVSRAYGLVWRAIKVTGHQHASAGAGANLGTDSPWIMSAEHAPGSNGPTGGNWAYA